jgi:hypothetical protein
MIEGDARTLAGRRVRGRGGDDHVGVAHAVARRGHGHRRVRRMRRGQRMVAPVPLPVRVPRRRRHGSIGRLFRSAREWPGCADAMADLPFVMCGMEWGNGNGGGESSRVRLLCSSNPWGLGGESG